MRILMWFTIGFAAACAGCSYLMQVPYLVVALVMLAGALITWLIGTKLEALRVLALLFLGTAVGMGWFWVFDSGYLNYARDLDGQIIDVSIQVTDYSYETDYGVAADGEVTVDGKAFRVRAYVDSKEQLIPGDKVYGTFRFRVTTSGGQEEATYHSGKGVFLLAYPVGESQIRHSLNIPLSCYPAYLRQRILSLLEETFPADTASFAKALLLGDSYDIGYETNTAFKISGIRHIIAVSGLHVSILCAMLMFLTGRRRILSCVVCIPSLLLFAAVAGFTPSITRACIMMILMMLAVLLRREYDGPTELAFAALVMLFINPLTITSVSFQLSVGCMIGIFLFSGKIRRYLLNILGGGKGKKLKAKLIRWFSGSVAVTLGAMSLTTPLSAYYFGAVSLVGVVTNLLTLWAVSFIFYGVVAVCLLGLLWLPLGQVVAWGISWLIRYVLLAAKALASLPMAAVYTRSIYIVLWLVLCYILFGIFLLVKHRSPVVYGSLAVITLCLALALSWGLPLMDDYRITVLDVGQGQCILLQSQGKTYMVDCGGDYDDTTADIAAETLLSQGISHIDGLILTHMDRDHAGGAMNLLTRISADAIFLPAGQEGEITALETTMPVDQNMVLAYGTTYITLLPGEIGDSDNESSLCVLFQTEKCDILITGDRTAAGELALIEQMELPKLEILVVGHHGSKTSTTEALLKQTQPATAVISVSADNSYGHPAQEVLDRLAQFGCTVYRTDRDGTIILRG